MFADIAANLAFFESAAIFSVAGVMIFATANFALVRLCNWNPPAWYAYGVLGGLKGGRLTALALILLRSLFFLSCIFSSATLPSAYVWYGLLLTLGVYVLLHDFRFIPFDACAAAATYAALVGQGKIRENSNAIQGGPPAAAILAVVDSIVVILSVIIFLNGIKSLAKRTGFLKIQFSLKHFLLKMALPAAAAIPMILIILILNQAGSLILHDEVYQYDGSKIVDYNGSNILKKTDEGSTLQPVGGKAEQLQSSPLYFQNRDKIITTGDSIIIRPKLLAVNRLPVMSRITSEKNGCLIETDSTNSSVSDFFIFDGKNKYMFFEPVIVNCGSRTINVSPFSCISVNYGSSLDIFDRNQKIYTEYNTGAADATVTMQCQAKVNLSTDILYASDGKEQMLFIQPNLLSDFK